MAFSVLGYLKKNSISTTLTAPILAADTSAPVLETAIFTDALGGLITQYIILAPDDDSEIIPEEITITGRSAASGSGNITGMTRGVNADGAIGAAHDWPAGTRVCVLPTIGLFNAIKANFAECIQRNGSVAYSASEAIYRTIKGQYLRIMGGLDYNSGAWIALTGENYTGGNPGGLWLGVSNAAKTSYVIAFTIVGGTNTPTPVFAGLKMGATASVADGGTITHGCGTTPTSVVCTASVSGEFISVTAKAATTFTVAIKKHDGSAGTTQTVNWIAWL